MRVEISSALWKQRSRKDDSNGEFHAISINPESAGICERSRRREVAGA